MSGMIHLPDPPRHGHEWRAQLRDMQRAAYPTRPHDAASALWRHRLRAALRWAVATPDRLAFGLFGLLMIVIAVRVAATLVSRGGL